MIDTIAPELDQIVTRKREGQDAAAVLLRQLAHRVGDDVDDRLRREPAIIIATTSLISDCEREEAGDRDDEEQRREQGEEKVVGLLGGQVEDVVGQRLLDGVA